MNKAAGLEYDTVGTGDAVLLIHGGIFSGAFVPLTREPALATRYRLIRYSRRGFAGSDGFAGPFSIEDQAADAAALLKHLGAPRAHVVGHSYGAVVATQLALDAPDLVRSLVLLEPAIAGMNPAWRAGHSELFVPLVARYRAGDVAGAVDLFMKGAEGRDWKAGVELALPGGVAQAEADGATFFEVELPAIEQWSFDVAAAGRIQQPVLYVTGGESPAHMERLGNYFSSCVPQTERAVIPGAIHSLHHQQPSQVAEAIVSFISRHPF